MNTLKSCDFPYQIVRDWDIWKETETELRFGNITPKSILTGDILKNLPPITDYLTEAKGEARNIKISALVVYGFSLKDIAEVLHISAPRVRQILYKTLKKHVEEVMDYSLYQLRRYTNKVYVLKALLNT